MGSKAESMIFAIGAATVYIGAAILGLVTGKLLGQIVTGKWRDRARSI